MKAELQKLLAECVGKRCEAERGAAAAAGMSARLEGRARGQAQVYGWVAGELERILESSKTEVPSSKEVPRTKE